MTDVTWVGPYDRCHMTDVTSSHISQPKSKANHNQGRKLTVL